MALSTRKKTAIGFWITGAIFIVVGGIIWNTSVNPNWLTIALPIVALVAEAVGVAITLPQLP